MNRINLKKSYKLGESVFKVNSGIISGRLIRLKNERSKLQSKFLQGDTEVAEDHGGKNLIKSWK
jgi:hypothetical protein